SPEQLSTVVDAVIQEAGALSLKEMGAVMKAVLVRLAGQTIDGKQISDLVRAKLQ
ncbi:MAG TPA: GatB/YqeY domain-containing protein, partial [Nitrospiraceae bacterium]|nr:GatB/YqeY domain-containing protein [Nitrospiraceae bacterium]